MSGGPIIIDGSRGEGGGQILRTAVALAAAGAKPVRLVNIRARRPKPGLRPQHLAAVQAAAAVCGGTLEGDRIGSRELTLTPGPLAARRYRFEIPTAGSAMLVAQTVIGPLALAEGESEAVITGGTHNPFAPCFEYVRDVFCVLASAMGVEGYVELARPGFYPAGGGEVHLAVRGGGLRAARLLSRGELRRVDGVSIASAALPGHIVERQAARAASRLQAARLDATIDRATPESASPGTALFLRAVFARSVAGFFGLGKRGKPAERVADEAVDALLAFLDADASVDPHAADQLVPLAALAAGESRWRTPCATSHLLTVAEVVRQVTGRTVDIDGRPGAPATVTVAASPDMP